MSVMANRSLSHSYNISVTDYQTGDSHTYTHSSTHTNNDGADKQKQERGFNNTE